MIYRWILSVCLVTTLINKIRMQKYEGDICELKHLGTHGTCVHLDACESAKRNNEQNGISPKFCVYNAFGSSLVCCEKGQSLVKTSEVETSETNTQSNPLQSGGSGNQKANSRSLYPSIRKTSAPAVGTLQWPLIKPRTKEDEEDASCVEDITGTLGTCTPLQQCHSAKLNLENNGVRPTFCKYNAFGESLVCCKDGKTILQTSRPKTADPRPLFAKENDDRRVSERKCDAYSGRVTQKVDVSSLLIGDDGLSVAATKCEYTGIDLIIGGEDARRGEFPHMAAIGWANYEGGYSFNCGGSLISTKFILTAGHCSNDAVAYNPIPVVARLGDQNIDSNINDGADPIDVPIRHVYPHPEYNPPLKYNDIALLELASDVQFENAIRPACLWTRPDYGEYNYGVATGWGVKNVLTKETSKELQKVSLSLLNNDFCDSILEHTHNRHWKGFRSNQMCAGELRGGKDTCHGDSGSPLQVTSKQNRCIYYIIGLTSFGKSCGARGTPAIYTRVSSYIDWIESVVWPGE